MISTAPRADFGDWLSPMLVKELRQGIRSRSFMAAFYLTQVLMILSVIFNLTAATENNQSASMLNGLFWFLIGVPMLFFMPIRGFGSLHGEIKSGTLELVFLTRLSALRIAAGKWTALMVQTLLLVAAVLPYVLLRYFLGGVNVVQDLQSLFVLVMASGMLTAATIAVSPYESKLLRALFSVGMGVGFLVLMPTLIGQIVASRFAGSSLAGGSPWLFYLGLALYAPAFICLGLELAASQIAPSAENHALRKRLIGFYLVLVPFALCLLGAEAVVVWSFSAVFLAVVLIDALAEPIVVVRSIYRAFSRHGAPGRGLSVILTPGWLSAAVYLVVIAIVAGLMLAFLGHFDDEQATLLFLAYFGGLIFPAAFLRALVPSSKFFLGMYIAIQFFFGAVTLLVSMVAEVSDKPLTDWLCLFPPSTFLLTLFDQVDSDNFGYFFGSTIFMTAVALAVFAVRGLRPLRDIRAALAQDSPPHV